MTRTLAENLLGAQKTLRTALAAERDALLRRLQTTIPAPVLAHFLRLVEQGRSGVTIVRHGVCSGCHLRVPSGTVAGLARPSDLHLCENCGSYLILAPEEMPGAMVRPVPTVTAMRKVRPRQLAMAV